ncbi:MAG: thioesterase family protein [Microbacteriaceae bacterium]|nr:thioesterase family protein [Microbacteriaceae bacterium]
MDSRFYFERLGDAAYRPTIETQGAWDPDELHFSPLGGLFAHAVRRYAAAHGTPGLQLARASYDILGKLSREDYEVDVQLVRPGRTIELYEAVARVGGRTVARARTWMLQPGPTGEVAGGAPAVLPHPDGLAAWPMSGVWPGRYVGSLEVRPIGEPQPGRATAWLRSPVDLLEGEHDPVASFIALVDTANGIAARQRPTEWMFPNVDLTIHLHREPAGPWVGLDTSVVFGSTGLGLTATVLHDEAGAVGVAHQALTVRRISGAK